MLSVVGDISVDNKVLVVTLSILRCTNTVF